jgi:hypothetical protein
MCVSMQQPESADCAQRRPCQADEFIRECLPKRGRISVVPRQAYMGCRTLTPIDARSRPTRLARGHFLRWGRSYRGDRYLEDGAQRSFPVVDESEPCLSHKGPVTAPSATLIFNIWTFGAVQGCFTVPASSYGRGLALITIVGSPEIGFRCPEPVVSHSARHGHRPTSRRRRMRLPEMSICHLPESSRYFWSGRHLSFPLVADNEPCLSHFGPVCAPSAALMVNIWTHGAIQTCLAIPARL